MHILQRAYPSPMPRRSTEIVDRSVGILSRAGGFRVRDCSDAIPFVLCILANLVPEMISATASKIQPSIGAPICLSFLGSGAFAPGLSDLVI